MEARPQDRRKYVRTPISAIGALISDGWEESCSVVEFSQGGAKVLTSERLAENQPIMLKIDGFGEFHCELAWQHEQRSGLRFMDPQHLSSRSAVGSLTKNIVGLDPF